MARLDYARKKKALIYAVALVIGVCCIVLSACNPNAGIYDVSDKNADLEVSNLIAKFIKILYENIGSFGWTVVAFTVILKVVLSPLDVWQKLVTRKNAKIMERMKPELEVLQAKYGDDKQRMQQEQMALYKREKYSMFSACLPTIVSLVLIIVMFAGFRELTGWKFASDYQKCYEAYDKSMTAQLGEDWENYQGNGEVYASAKENAQQAVFDFYYADAQVESRSFLWIKNIFSPDSWSKAVPDYETVSGQSGGYSTRITGVTADEYESVMGKLIGQGGWGKNGSWNGWLLLPFFTLVLGIVSQKLLAVTQGTGEKKEKKSFKEKWENLKNLGQPKEGQEPNAQDQSQASMKMMQYMMPLISAVFALMYSSAFALYMVVNSFVSTLIQLIFNLAFMIADKREKEGLSKPSKVKAKK